MPPIHLGQLPLRFILAALSAAAFIIFSYATWTSEDLWRVRRTLPPNTAARISKGPKAAALSSVHNRTLGFQKIFALGLPERTDRRDGLTLAAAVSNFDFEFVDGIHGETLLDKVLPPSDHGNLKANSIGAWRGHMNAIRKVVHGNLQSALIIEDDVDWDVRLRPLLSDLARSTSSILKQPEAGELDFSKLAPTPPPMGSPYGSGWDVLWLGHCGMKPETNETHVLHFDDVSVPEPQFLHSYEPTRVTPLIKYANHTRMTMHFSDATCSLAYAVSQSGARKILHDIGLENLYAPFDLMLRDWCVGAKGFEAHQCLGVLPQLFNHYRARGPATVDSDINKPNEGQEVDIRKKPMTSNIRWTVRMNIDRLLKGETVFEDQYPDSDTLGH
ncbi:hypothetical protein MMC25_007018 [Agyrium rufum]|nr:hypothetical protein [Agyrium rufum]